jgi:hypothetical protein
MGRPTAAPTETQDLIAEQRAWAARLAQAEKLVEGEKLTDDGGRHLPLAQSQAVANDGSYAEAHDVVGR